MRRSALIGLGVAAAIGTAVGAAARGPTLMPWPSPLRRAFPGIVGGLVGAPVGVAAGMTAAMAQRRFPRWQSVVAMSGVGIGLAGAGAAAGVRVRRAIEQRNRRPDPGLATGPTSPLVSGSPSSMLAMDELGREGLRFVSFPCSPADISAVTGRPPVAEPIRIFIGVDAAASAEQRVALAMAELRRTDAFARQAIMVVAPAGTGYANATPVDALELLTGGDCASVVVAFGLLPSFMSLGTVAEAGRAQRLLLDALSAEIAQIEAATGRRPRILLYGESLGASIQQAAVPAGPTDLDAFTVSAAVWVGTPGGQFADAMHARCADEALVLDSAGDIPDPLPAPAPRVWFLEHDADPVVRFRPALLASRPAWLPRSGVRGRGVPEAMTFRPVITYLQVLVDTLFATDVEPGEFMSVGHDYRADLGRTILAACALDPPSIPVEAFEGVLADLEARRGRILT